MKNSAQYAILPDLKINLEYFSGQASFNQSALEWLKLSPDHIDLIERIISKMKINTVL
jgi:hypothetical protein